jgi:hypothetical protein
MDGKSSGPENQGGWRIAALAQEPASTEEIVRTKEPAGETTKKIMEQFRLR